MKAKAILTWTLALATCLMLPLTAQSTFPPQVTILGKQMGNTEGTAANPFAGLGIDLSLDIQDPDPTFYVLGAWGESHVGNFCSNDPGLFRFFGAEGFSPIMVHPGVESGVARITIRVNITENPHPTMLATQTFFIVPNPLGCDGVEPPPPNAPSDVDLRINKDDVTLGTVIQLTASAQDLDDITFRYFVDSTAFPLQRGSLIAQQTVSGCQAGCERTIAFTTAEFPTTQFFSIEAEDEEGNKVGSPVKQAVRVTVFGPSGFDPDPPPSPQICQCAGGTTVTVDAGPPNRSVVGGQTLDLVGDALGPNIGGLPIPGSFLWSIVGNGGLGNSLVLDNSSQLNASLMTPDVSVDVVAVVRFSASFSGCSCADNMIVNILANPPLQADLSVRHLSSPGAFTPGQTINYQLQVRNTGPGTAQDAFLRDLLPDGTTFLSATPSQGSCQLDLPNQVTCDLGNLVDEATATVDVAVRADAVGAPQNVAFVFAQGSSDPSLNNDSDFQTDIVQLTNLDEELFFAQFGDGQGLLSSQIILLNTDPNETANARVSLRDDNGAPLSVDLNGLNVDGETTLSIPPSGLSILETDGAGPLRVGSVTVFSDRPLAGTILFNGLVGVAGVGSSARLTQGFVAPIESNTAGGINTGVALMNLGNGQTTVDLQLRDVNGALLTTAQLPALPPAGHVSLNIDEFDWVNAPDFSNFQGLLTVTPSDAVAATVIQTRPGEFATFPVAATAMGTVSASNSLSFRKRFRVGGGGEQLFFAQFGDGTGLFSQLILLNLSQAQADVEVILRKDDGTPLTVNLGEGSVMGQTQRMIPAQGLLSLRTPGTDPDVQVGSVEVRSVSPLSGVILFGGTLGVAGVGNSAATDNGFVAPIEGNTAQSIRTGIAVMNLEDAQTVLSLTLRNQNGSAIASAEITLAAGGHRALFADEVDWTGSPDFTSFRGTLRVTSGGARIAATAIQTRPSQFATLPVASLSGN